MNITVLGYWGGYPHAGEGTTSYLIESSGYTLLLDAGSTTMVQLQKQMDPIDLDAVLLTHYHHDHIADLGVLQYCRQLSPLKPNQILPIYGHTEDKYRFESLNLEGVSKAIPYTETDSLTIGPFQVTFKRTVHPVPCFATRIVEKETGKIFVFTADTGYFEALSDFCKDADVLITDTYFLEGNENHHAHLTSKETGILAKQANVKQLVLSHLNQTIDIQRLISETKRYAPDIPVQAACIGLTLKP